MGLPIIAGYTYSYANTVDKAKRAADAFIKIGTPKGIDTMALDLEDKSMMGLGSKIIPIINIYRDIAQAANMNFLIYTGASYYNPCLKPYIRYAHLVGTVSVIYGVCANNADTRY